MPPSSAAPTAQTNTSVRPKPASLLATVRPAMSVAAPATPPRRTTPDGPAPDGSAPDGPAPGGSAPGGSAATVGESVVTVSPLSQWVGCHGTAASVAALAERVELAQDRGTCDHLGEAHPFAGGGEARDRRQ